MDFIKVLKRMGRLHSDFHTYYTLYKFHEMIDYLDMNEVAVTCHTFNKHNIRATVHHPLMKNLMFKIKQKLFENANTISSQALHFTDKYLSKFDVGISSNNFWKDFCENANRNSSLDSDALLTIIYYASFHFQELEMHPLYIRLEAELKNDMISLKYLKSISYLLILMRKGYFQESQSILLENALKQMKTVITNNNDAEIDKMVLLLWFAYFGLYDKEVYDLFKNQSSSLIRLENGKYELSNSILYAQSGETDNINMISSKRFCLKLIDGLMKYRGIDALELTENSTKRNCEWSELLSPLVYQKYYSEKDRVMPEYVFEWCQIGTQIPKILSEKFNLNESVYGKYVIETKILPFFELVDYVFCLDENNKLVELPEVYKNQDYHKVKNIPTEYQHYKWCTLLLVHSRRMHNFHKKFSDPSHLHLKYTHDLGYHISLFDAAGYEFGTDHCENDLRQLIDLIILENA